MDLDTLYVTWHKYAVQLMRHSRSQRVLCTSIACHDRERPNPSGAVSEKKPPQCLSNQPTLAGTPRQNLYNLLEDQLTSCSQTTSLCIERKSWIHHTAHTLLNRYKILAIIQTTVDGVSKGSFPGLSPCVLLGCCDGLAYPVWYFGVVHD